MGLDMYLHAEKYLSVNFSPELQTKVKTLVEDLGIDVEPSGITVKLMYWRKANQIHDWFVKNVQDGVDDCKRYIVYPETLQLLKDTIDKVLADTSQAATLLPPSKGFFFGSTDIDEWYWRDLEETSKKLGEILESEPLRDWDIYYRSSW